MQVIILLGYGKKRPNPSYGYFENYQMYAISQLKTIVVPLIEKSGHLMMPGLL